jgi:hypothetical protein
LRVATDADKHLPAYDNTKLQAINTCPVYGIITYSLHRRMGEANGRAMALEMGTAAHDLFAAVRLWQLREYEGHEGLADYHGKRLFGSDRYSNMLGAVSAGDDRARSMDFALACLESTGFYDDPRDKRRTYSNLEEACILYIDRWNWRRHNIWIRDPDDQQSDVGIEIPFDVVLTFTLTDDTVLSLRYIGKADGLHQKDGQLILHENKTASRLDDAWRMSFSMSTQITGYMFALSVWAGAPIVKGDVFGMTVPLPRTMEYGGVIREPVTRQDHHFKKWCHWFLTTALLDQQFRDDPSNAPHHTHSCNRYFRPCSLIPYCDSSEEDKQTMIEEMTHHEWSPLFEVNQGGD